MRETIRHNLPAHPTPFIGREEELADLHRLLVDPACRLLTLLGPGGMGKTRLALEAAAREAGNLPASFPDGIYFVPLQSLSSEEYIIPALAEAIKFPFSRQDDPRTQLIKYLQDKQALLVMDNFEHLLEGVGFLAELLNQAAHLKILATSREVLGLQEEWIRPVTGLKYPEDGQARQAEEFSAVQLFAERARRVQGGFSLAREHDCVARICRLVEGMPLALELAAAWTKILPCGEIAAEIQRNLDFLSTSLRNVPERHRNVRAVFEQSWKLLGDAECEAFKQLAVFQGGFQREAAQAVAGASLETLSALVDKSLLHISPTGRYGIHELLRQFALEKLEPGSTAWSQTEDRHGAYYAAYLQRLETRLKGAEQLLALSELDAELDNIRAAWRWAVEQHRAEGIQKSLGSLLMYFQMRTRLHEAVEAFQRAENAFADSGAPVLADIYLRNGWFHATTGHSWKATKLYRVGIDLTENGEFTPVGIMALSGITFLWYLEDKPWTDAEIQGLYHQNLARSLQAGDHWGAAWSYYSLGFLAFNSDQQGESRQLLLNSIERFREMGNRWGSTWAINQLGIVMVESGEYAEASSLFQESLAICEEVGDVGGVAYSLAELADIAANLEDYPSSWKYLLDSLQIAKDTKRDLDIYWNLIRAARLIDAEGDKERAVELLAFLYSNPALYWSRDYIRESLLEPWEAELPPEVFERAKRRGEASQLPAVLDALESEYPRPEEDSRKGSWSKEIEVQSSPSSLIEPLSRRELEVLGLVADGLSNREIAGRLVVTVGAVKKHLNNIFGKLQVASRTQAIARARELQLFE